MSILGNRMNERIIDLYEQASLFASEEENPAKSYKDRVMIKFAELIVRECDRLNRKQSLELAGVVADVEQGNGFDSVCLATVKRVENYLADSTLKQHFGVEV